MKCDKKIVENCFQAIFCDKTEYHNQMIPKSEKILERRQYKRNFIFHCGHPNIIDATCRVPSNTMSCSWESIRNVIPA